MTNQNSKIIEKNNPVGIPRAGAVILDILYVILSVFYLPTFLFNGKHRPGIVERCGIYPHDVLRFLANSRQVIWLHAVSVGEIRAAVPLIEALREKYPEAQLLISTITPTGNAVARQIAVEGELVIYFPFDLSPIVRKAISIIRPKMILIMETELWPNFITEAFRQDIPIAIINGRISDNAFLRYKKAGWFFRPILKNIDLFCMQTPTDAKRIEAIGARKNNIRVTGNLKFDQIIQPGEENTLDLGLTKNQRLIVAGSTHDQEEQIITQVFIKLKAKYPDIRLLIAPRHPHRAKAVEQVIKDCGLTAFCLSQIKQQETAPGNQEVLILDTMGMLNNIYALADIVFIGGSLVPHGGHNPIEPAVCGKPVVFGKHMFNFAEIAGIFLSNQAAVSVKDEQELYDTLHSLLKDADKRRDLARRAQKVISDNRGSVKRVMDIITEQFKID
ncbi:MAG: 3-deoxy-D-manno-octulosonic acid transferase [Candidatus Omnitrophota bacterium]